MKESFGTLPSGETATLYTITNGRLTAAVTDYGATLVRLLVPNAFGNMADVVLGHDDCTGYEKANGSFLSATVGRNANRLKDAYFTLGERVYRLPANEGNNNHHSGPNFYHLRRWNTVDCSKSSVTFELVSPDGDQDFPGTRRSR